MQGALIVSVARGRRTSSASPRSTTVRMDGEGTGASTPAGDQGFQLVHPGVPGASVWLTQAGSTIHPARCSAGSIPPFALLRTF